MAKSNDKPSSIPARDDTSPPDDAAQSALPGLLAKAAEIAQANGKVAQQRKQKRAQEDAVARRRPMQMSFFTPDEHQRPIPNLLARCPIFAPIQRGRRRNLDDELLPTHGTNVEIRYTGKQLDQSDCDVFMQTLFLLRGKTLGDAHVINRSQLLRALGKTDAGKNYALLDETYGRLVGGQLIINSPLYKGRVTLVSKWVENKETGEYYVVIDEDVKKLFGGEQYTLVDWQRRLQITKRVDLAKWLQNWICSHEKGLQRWSIEYLYTLCKYNSPIRKFREALLDALDELGRVGVITEHKFYEDDTKVRWHRL